MPALNNITFIGKSGAAYDFHAYPMDEAFQPKGAVYLITNRYQDKLKKYNHIKIYIGETDDLSNLFNNHLKALCFKEYDANCICVYPDESREERLRIRDDLYDNYHTPCND